MSRGQRRDDPRAGTSVGASVGSRRFQNLLFVVALLGVAAGTAGGFLFARDTAEDDAQERVDAIATTAGSSLTSLVDRRTDALRGASAVVNGDGSFDLGAFAAYAGDLASEGAVGPVSLIGIVDGDQREAVEALIGEPIRSLGPDGELTPAPEADVYYPLLDTSATEGSNVIGLDYRSDAVRGPATEEAVATGASVVSEPTLLPRTGERGVVIVHPLFVGGAKETGPLAGFVATGLALPDLLDSLAGTLPVGSALTLRDDGEVIAMRRGPGGDFATRVGVDVGTQHWELTVDPDEEADAVLAQAVLAGGVVAELWVLIVFVTTVRYQRRMRRANASLARAENRSRTLERLGSTLSRSLSGVEVGRATLESLPGLTGAVAGAVAVLSDDGSQLELVEAWGYGLPSESGTAEALAPLRRVPIEGSLLADVLRTGEPAWLPSPLSWRDEPAVGRYADVGKAAAVVALHADHSVGVLVIVQPNVRSFGDDERSLVTTVAALAARALDRSLRYDADHATAVAFQQASLPVALPEAPGLLVAARYRPATRLAEVGGDWYDVLTLDGGRSAVIVGDVVGHGVSAAAAMGQVRVALRVLASVESAPTALLRLLSAQVPEIPDAMCATMAFGVVDPVAGRFSYVLAGHPPPLLLRKGEPAMLLDGLPWPPLGVVPHAEPGPAWAEIGPGDVLVLYTDGVIERRGESLTVGLERLRWTAQALRDLSPADLADALLESLVPTNDQSDDVALLVVRIS